MQSSRECKKLHFEACTTCLALIVTWKKRASILKNHKPVSETYRCGCKYPHICFPPDTCIFPHTPTRFYKTTLKITGLFDEFYKAHKKDQTHGKVQVITPLLHEVPSGRSTELTLQGPMSHWQVSTVALASKSKPKRFRISKQVY